MELLKKDKQFIDIRISRDELTTLYACMNEVCHGIDLFEFQTRIGESREEVIRLMKAVDDMLIDK